MKQNLIKRIAAVALSAAAIAVMTSVSAFAACSSGSACAGASCSNGTTCTGTGCPGSACVKGAACAGTSCSNGTTCTGNNCSGAKCPGTVCVNGVTYSAADYASLLNSLKTCQNSRCYSQAAQILKKYAANCASCKTQSVKGCTTTVSNTVKNSGVCGSSFKVYLNGNSGELNGKLQTLINNYKSKTCSTCPNTASKPAAPVKTATPATPVTPAKPTTPATPATPAKPTTPATPTAPANTNTGSSVLDIEREVVTLVNQIRVSNGLSALTLNENLSKVARAKAVDMATNNYFSHTSPTYGSPFDMMTQFGITYRTAGENIAMGYSTAQAVVDAWMNSEGHRANILNSSYTQIGVGYASNGNYWSQMFIG